MDISTPVLHLELSSCDHGIRCTDKQIMVRKVNLGEIMLQRKMWISFFLTKYKPEEKVNLKMTGKM
jgi:hypothetical protein